MKCSYRYASFRQWTRKLYLKKSNNAAGAPLRNNNDGGVDLTKIGNHDLYK
jgi:hypothetical protein